MDTRLSRSAVLALAALGAPGCFPPPPLPPTAGYGVPYHGTGEGIYVKDSRDDWDITEGHHKITSEQALEAAGDPEYEARRQIAKTYNERLYDEALAHHHRAYRVMEASAAAIVVGTILSLVVAPRLQSEHDMAAGAGMPELRTYTSGFPTELTATLGGTLLLGGVIGLPYAYWGGRRPPPYHEWRTPDPLNRPAYVRQQTEPYNEKIGAPTIPDVETGTEPAAAELQLPGARRTPARHIPHPRGER